MARANVMFASGTPPLSSTCPQRRQVATSTRASVGSSYRLSQCSQAIKTNASSPVRRRAGSYSYALVGERPRANPSKVRCWPGQDVARVSVVATGHGQPVCDMASAVLTSSFKIDRGEHGAEKIKGRRPELDPSSANALLVASSNQVAIAAVRTDELGEPARLSKRDHWQVYVRCVVAGVMNFVLGNDRLALALVRATGVQVAGEFRKIR